MRVLLSTRSNLLEQATHGRPSGFGRFAQVRSYALAALKNPAAGGEYSELRIAKRSVRERQNLDQARGCWCARGAPCVLRA